MGEIFRVRPRARHEFRLGALTVLLISGDDALARVLIEPDDAVRAGVSSLPAVMNGPITGARLFLDAYASGKSAPLPLLDLAPFSENERRVYETLAGIHAGGTVTYGELAERSGFPGAARFVGHCMRKNNFPVIIPCHRVIPASGGIGNYTPDPRIKKYLLDFESGKIDPGPGDSTFRN